jgi:hypothetical protein
VRGILSKCESLRDLQRIARRHHGVLTETLGIELKRPPSDSAFRYFFPQVDVASICAAIRDWTLAQIPGVQWILTSWSAMAKLCGVSIEPTAGGASAFIAQVTLYSASLGLAIAQGCYATNQGNGTRSSRCSLTIWILRVC